MNSEFKMGLLLRSHPYVRYELEKIGIKTNVRDILPEYTRVTISPKVDRFHHLKLKTSYEV